jgi:hypothetical protein
MGNVAICQTVALPNMSSSHYIKPDIFKMSNCRNVKLEKCQPVKLPSKIVDMSNCQNVKLSKCQTVKMSKLDLVARYHGAKASDVGSRQSLPQCGGEWGEALKCLGRLIVVDYGFNV